MRSKTTPSSCSMLKATSAVGTQAPSVSRATRPQKSSESISPVFIPKVIARLANLKWNSKLLQEKGASKKKAGAFARMARDFGPV